MHSEMSTLPFPDRAPPNRSTVQNSQGSTCHGDWDCQLEHGHHTTASVETLEAQYPGPSPGGARDVSICEALQLPSRPSQSLARNSGLVGVTSSLDHAVDQNWPSSIDPRLVNHTRDSRVMQGHASDYATIHGTTLPPSYMTSPLLPHASRFGIPGNSFAAPAMCQGPIPPVYYDTAGQAIDPNTPRPRLPNPVCPPHQGPHRRLPVLAYASAHQFLTHIFPSESDSTSYPTPTPTQNSSSWSPQEYTRFPSPVQPHSQQIYSTGSPGFHTGNQMELYASSTLVNHTAQSHSDHPSHALSADGRVPCGWRDDEGKECGMPVHHHDCNDHYATVHGIKGKARDFKITCRWCPPEKRKELSRHNFLRHMREAHLGCSRTKKGGEVSGLCARPNNRSTGLR